MRPIWWTALLFVAAVAPLYGEIRIDEFSDLDEWREVAFPDIDRSSGYSSAGDGEYLRVSSDSSASMLVLDRMIDVYETPIVRWRWRVDSDVAGADLTAQEGDDAAIRLYVAFRVPPEELPFGRRLWARVQERVYGASPPDSALSFVWTNEHYDERAFRSSYTDRQFLLLPSPIEGGEQQIGVWAEQRVNLLETYRELFDSDPPREAYIAIMGDSDNTGGSSEALLDFVSVVAE